MRFFYAFAIACTPLWASISEHEGTINLLKEYMSDAQKKVKQCQKLIHHSKKARVQLMQRFEELRNTIPIKITENHGFEFRYYPGNIILYQSDKGKGIRIESKEKLYQKASPNSFNYSNERFHFQKQGDHIRIYTSTLSYSAQRNTQRLIHIHPTGETLYTYSSKTYNPQFTHETLNLSGDTYTLKKNTLTSASPTQTFSFKNTTQLHVTDQSKRYTLAPQCYYTIYPQGLLYMSEAFRHKLFTKEFYYADIQKDLTGPYMEYLDQARAHIQASTTNDALWLRLINLFRETHARTPITTNTKLTKIAKAHARYLMQHNPSNPHYQKRTHKEYTGTTTFQRKKHFHYPHKLSEWIAWGDDPLYDFYLLTQQNKWSQILLHPRAIHFGYANIQKRHILLIGTT